MRGLPRFVLVGLLFGSVLTGVILAYGLGLISMNSNQEDISFHTIANDVDARGYAEPANLIINDQGNWSEVWSKAFCSSGYRTRDCSPPYVNFTSSTVIAVFLGARDEGWRVEIDKIVRTGQSLTVTVQIHEPGCQTPTLFMAPFHIIDIRRTSLITTFTSRTILDKC